MPAVLKPQASSPPLATAMTPPSPPSYYGPVTSYQSTDPGYDTNYIGPWRERQLQGRD